MTLTAITLSVVDETTTAPDVIAAAEANSTHEVYPESLVPPVDADPVWLTPTGAVVVPAHVVSTILEAALVGLEDCPLPGADEAFDAVQTLIANLPVPFTAQEAPRA